MIDCSQHLDDADLSLLLFADEDSETFQVTAAHVEGCDTCRQRLDALSGPTRFDDDARQLLSDYSWDEATGPGTVRVRGESDASVRQTLELLGPPSHPEMLGRLGRYEIERVLGAGGMGVVLKAFDTELNRTVAVKILARHLAYSGAARQRFARESRAAAAVVHEHVVAIHNVESDGEIPFLVMQYVPGESLQARVERTGPLDATEILRIGMQTAAGLAAAHEQGVIHRDIKPTNILLENAVERVMITDFGLARTVDDASLTHTGIVAGTPHYMSPEQAGGEPTDHRTDLFSLGSVLYFLATGRTPFRAERMMGVLHRICRDRQRPVWELNPRIPDELSDVIDRLLEKKPARRFAKATEVRDTLSRLLARQQDGALRRRGRVGRLIHRRRWPVATACVLLIPAITALGLVTAELFAPDRENKSAELTEPPAVPIDADIPVTDNPMTADLVTAVREPPVPDLLAESALSPELVTSLQRLDAMFAPALELSPDQEFDRQIGSFDRSLDALQANPFPPSFFAPTGAEQ